MRRAALIAVLCLSSSSLADWKLVDEPVYLFIDNDKHGNTMCSIDVHLWVLGPKRENCIRRLEQAAHLARFEVWAGATRARRP